MTNLTVIKLESHWSALEWPLNVVQGHRQCCQWKVLVWILVQLRNCVSICGHFQDIRVLKVEVYWNDHSRSSILVVHRRFRNACLLYFTIAIFFYNFNFNHIWDIAVDKDFRILCMKNSVQNWTSCTESLMSCRNDQSAKNFDFCYVLHRILHFIGNIINRSMWLMALVKQSIHDGKMNKSLWRVISRSSIVCLESCE